MAGRNQMGRLHLGVMNRNVAGQAGIRPQKLDLTYATEAAFLTAKSDVGLSGSGAEGDWFYDTTLNALKIHDGTDFRVVNQYAGQKHVLEPFEVNPVSAKIAGGAATGTAGDENCLAFPNNNFEYHILGTQTILAPSLTAEGLDVGMDQTANDGIELTQGITARSPVAFTVGTDAAFFASLKLKLADVSGSDDCVFGFRKAEAYQANVDDYDEMAALNIIAGAINIETILNNAATTTTDTTDTVADDTEVTLKVLVSAAGVVTYTIDGAAPTTTAAFTFDDTEVVVPFFYFLHDTDLAGEVELIEWEVGYQ